MIIGIPTEVKDNEYRVAATPEGVRELAAAGHEVVLQSGAGEAPRSAMRNTCAPERHRRRRRRGLRPGGHDPDEGASAGGIRQVQARAALFTFLHLAADRALTEFLAERDVTSVAYETVSCPTGASRSSRR